MKEFIFEEWLESLPLQTLTDELKEDILYWLSEEERPVIGDNTKPTKYKILGFVRFMNELKRTQKDDYFLFMHPNYPDRWLTEEELYDYYFNQPSCDHNWKEWEDEECNARLRCTRCKTVK
jgi:hypothetical protein